MNQDYTLKNGNVVPISDDCFFLEAFFCPQVRKALSCTAETAVHIAKMTEEIQKTKHSRIKIIDESVSTQDD